MPMLERAAASLEPCSRPRVLPSSTNPRKSRQRLHTTFWHHGAADIELSNAWQTLLHGQLRRVEYPGAETNPDSMTASAFLLDFLYPNGALNFLRRLSPTAPERYEIPPLRLGRTTPRLYISSMSHARSTPLSPSRELVSSVMMSPDVPLGADTSGAALRGDALRREPDGFDPVEVPHSIAEGDLSLGDLTRTMGPRELHDILDGESCPSFDRVWELYSSLNNESRARLRPAVIVHLANSSRPVEAWRVSKLFRELKREDWNEDVVVAAITAELALHKSSDAVSIFEAALDSQGLVNGLGHILAYAIKESAWELFVSTWGHFLLASSEASRSRSRFEEVVAIPDLAGKLSELYSRLDQWSFNASPEIVRDQVDAFMKILSKQSLTLLELPAAVFVLERANDPLAYEDFINTCLDRGQNALAAQMYRKYRKLHGVRVRIPTLHRMIDAFSPHDVCGMEQVLKDWYGRYERLDALGYTKFLKFYANRGDVKSVDRMWTEWTKHYPEVVSTRRDAFTYLLQVYAVRGELHEVHRVFDEISEKFNCQPSTACWNVLLNAHVKAKDFDGALEVFSDLCRSTTPDQYSFGTVMWMTGCRGDLEFTLELYRSSKAMRIKPTMVMTKSLIAAYCQNDRFSEAENLCLATTKQKKVRGECTTLWNTLLSYNATRRDLDTVHRLLRLMTKLDVPYDNATYDNLLSALVYCRQSHHALHLLKVAQAEKAFQVTPYHFVLLMGGFLSSGEPHMALKVNEMMNQLKLPNFADRANRVIAAASKWRQLPRRLLGNRESGEFLGDAMREFQAVLQRQEAYQRQGVVPTIPDSMESLSKLHARMIFTLIQFRDLATVHELIGLYKKSFPHHSSPEDVPVPLLSAMMLADFHEGKYDLVKQSWSILFRRTRTNALSANVEGRERHVLPAYRYALCDPLKTMQRVYLMEKDPAGLRDLVRQVTEGGFLLDSKNWNYYIQALARLKWWKEAFTVCEETLMPNWAGWYRLRAREPVKNQLPLQWRQQGTAPQHLRPISHTLMILAKEYLELRQMVPWSYDAEKLLNEINDGCQRTVRAITTMVRSHSQLEDAIFAGREPTSPPDRPGQSSNRGCDAAAAAAAAAATEDVPPGNDQDQDPEAKRRLSKAVRRMETNES